MKGTGLSLCLFAILCVVLFSGATGCQTTDTNTTTNTNNNTTTTTTTTDTNNQQTTQVTQPEIIKQQEVDGVIFENVATNVDLVKLKKGLDEFFALYEATVLAKDYDKWVTMLTDKYKKKYGDPASLTKMGLQLYNIYSLKDWFYLVVYNARIKLNQGKPLTVFKIAFNDKDMKKAIVYAKFEDKILSYIFINTDTGWKIGVPEDFDQ